MVTPNPYSPSPSPMLPSPVSRQPVAALVMETYPTTNLNANLGAMLPDAFQRSQQAGLAPGFNNAGFPAQQFPGASSFPVNPGMAPQQQLQAAYNDALQARAQAEYARNSYLGLANNLNGQAYQNQMAQLNQNPYAAPGVAGYPAGFQPTSVDQLQAMAQQQGQQQLQQLQPQPIDLQQQQAQAQMQQMQQAAMAQQQAEQQMLQQQQAQAAMAQQQQAMQQMQQPQGMPGQPQDLSFASTEELNRMIGQAQTLQDKMRAMAELAEYRKQGTPETYELLKREAMAETSMLPPGNDANKIRMAAFWTLGILNAVQNAQAPTVQLPGLSVISQVVADPKTDPGVKVAAIQALQVINRPQDPAIQQILSRAQKDSNPDVKLRAQSALAGEAIPVPSAQPQAGYQSIDPTQLQAMAQQQAQQQLQQLQVPGMNLPQQAGIPVFA